MTVLPTLSTIVSEQTTATNTTRDKVLQLLDYLSTNPKATIWYYASDIILNIFSNESYQSERHVQSRALGHFFMGWIPKDDKPIKLNGAILTLCSILCLVAASAAETDFGTLFLNTQEGKNCT